MISKFEDLNKLFEDIDNNISEKVHFYVIGGAMLLYHGLKESTKDVDIVVDNEKEFLLIQRTLKKLNFVIKVPTFEYKRVNLSQIFIQEDFRIDLFHKLACKGFQLTDTMKKRALKIVELKHLMVSLCSNEDVFLFKTFTEREADITDCLSLAQKKKIDWNIILEEVKRQIKKSGNKVWITWVGERLDILEERDLEIPIMKEINKLREDYFNDYEKKHSKNKLNSEK